MKKAIVTYSKAIWFKLMNDDMTQNEAILLFCIAMGLSLLGIHIGDTLLGGGQ
ncbi:hypothetical protein [Mucilaginibacter sp. 5C4]|uniref:hypothetical protein n=1 Tax=Mucilaginibacter sp. 5C4 TaxID=3048589 RepID=UPI002AC9E089|nr:hypothetical protein [Mucilaginibacter sp. 5C4]MEB0299586.1 hypothetical protein [Mucilaginibacter sp. 5C4]WPX22949.1 hypothetical protein RHM67_16840 [Mucilaginibacter sp. 5C4]